MAKKRIKDTRPEPQPEPALPEGIILARVVRAGRGYVVGDEIGVTEAEFRELGRAVVRIGAEPEPEPEDPEADEAEDEE